MIFIGTGSGITSLKRFHTSFLLSYNDYNLLVDEGDGLSRALLKSKVEFSEINSIVLSHFHPDHLNGISSLLVQMKMNKRKNKLSIFVHNELIELFLKFLEINYIFKLRLGYELVIIPFQTNLSCNVSGKFSFTARENNHLSKLSDFVKPGDKTLVSCSFLFEIENKKIFYTGDVGSKEDLYLFDDFSADYMICEYSHIELHDLYDINKGLNTKILMITHISDEDEQELYSWYSKLEEKERLVISEDGLELEL